MITSICLTSAAGRTLTWIRPWEMAWSICSCGQSEFQVSGPAGLRTWSVCMCGTSDYR